MQTITKTFELYEFDELSKEAKNRAVGDQIEFEVEFMTEESPYYHCALEMDKMQTPWFTGEYIYETHKEDIIHNIKINNFLFFKDGEITPIDFYPNKD